MSNEIAKLDQVLIQGDLSTLSTEQKLGYYSRVCESLGLNPLTKPFAYIKLNSKEVLYATRDCTDQLRSIQKISMSIVSREVIEGIYVVTAKGRTLDGREDEATGAVSIDKLSGEMKANAFMKAETKAKRRLTLSICGLGFTDESEIESIPGAKLVDIPTQEPAKIEAPQKETKQDLPQDNFDLESFMIAFETHGIKKLETVTKEQFDFAQKNAKHFVKHTGLWYSVKDANDGDSRKWVAWDHELSALTKPKKEVAA